jgi:hypothetical protein
MKKTVMVLGMLLSTLGLVAGGNVTKTLPAIVEVPAVIGTENKIYVEDNTQLMWQDQSYTEAENGAFKNQRSLGKAGSFTHAVSYCSRLHYAGYSDWRLPTSDELTHMHKKEGQVFYYFRDNDFWSSTPTTKNRYYVVFPADAYRYARPKRQSNFIRCVRNIKK